MTTNELTDALPAILCGGCDLPANDDGPCEDDAADGNVLCPACHAKAAASCEPTATGVEEFTAAYVAAMLWSSTDGDEPLDADYGPDDFDGDAMEQIRIECYDFCRANAYDIESWERCDARGRSGDNPDSYSSAGHDFWLTRVGHGAGFWDGDWPESAGARLDAAAKAAGNRDIYVCDDNKLHFYQG